MTTRAVLLVAALALAVSGAACTKNAAVAPGVRFRQPSSLAVFRGITLGDPNAVKPYLVVANQSRNDLTILDGVTDEWVYAPVRLRALVLPVANRPTLVAAASLGDDPAIGEARPDLLVAVSSGDSVLQLVETWNKANRVHSEPTTDPLAVELGYDVRALAVVPSPAGTARIAALLADRRIAVVTYARQADGSVAPVLPAAVGDPLPFEPVAIAAMPGDPAQTSLFVATRDPIATGADGRPVYGVVEVSLAGLAPVRALGARAPTRLVAAARLQERNFGDFATGVPDPRSAKNDQSAFEGRPEVRRVYAVLDESGCGPGKPIDCGVVSLDPSVASGTLAIPHDRTPGSASPGDAFMPYRAPMRIPGRPLAIIASGPPVRAPPHVDGEPTFADQSPYMRLYSAGVARATTAVAAVPSDDGQVYYLDLGRFEAATTSLAVLANPDTAAMPAYARPPTCTKSTDDQKPECARRRLWLKTTQPPAGVFLEKEPQVPSEVAMTPGWTPDQQWLVVYQGLLSSLYARAGEAGQDAGGDTWVALQTGVGGGTFNQVVRLWDPALGVHEGDLVVVKARAVGCTGTIPPAGVDADREFYVQVASLLPPDAASYPGGAVKVTRVATDEDPAWTTCYDALQAATAGGQVLRGLVVSVRAGAYVLTGTNAGATGGVPVELGYMGRPQPNVEFTRAYQDEDALAAACPLEGWDWKPPAPTCDTACRDACETLAIVRKLRRYQDISVDCSSSTNATYATACTNGWPGNKFPLVPSPTALSFTFDLQRNPDDPSDPADPTVGSTPFRDLQLAIVSRSNVTLAATSTTGTSPFQANGITAFDRSPWTPDAAAGYRFLVSYPADFVLDASPGQSGINPTVVR